MKTKKYLILAIVSFSILIVLWPGRRITGETGLSAKEKKTDSNLATLEKLALSYKMVVANEKEILQGLQGVSVLVESIEPEAEKYGFTTQALQTDTELQLRQYGIKVLNLEEWQSTPGRPCLHINVNVLIDEDRPFASASIAVELREAVLLLREPKIICMGSNTWHSGCLVSVGMNKIKNIRESVKDHVNEFINDYYAANPTKNPPASLPPTKATQTESGGKNGMTALYFTQGSHKDDVLRAQGTPDAINSYTSFEVWSYGLSTVKFSTRDDRVTQWDNYGNLKVKLEPRKNVIALTVSPSKTKPPQKGLIRGIIYSGNKPSALIGSSIVYEGDIVGGVKIVKIYIEKVEFEKEGTQTPLKWTQKIGEAPKEHWE